MADYALVKSVVGRFDGVLPYKLTSETGSYILDVKTIQREKSLIQQFSINSLREVVRCLLELDVFRKYEALVEECKKRDKDSSDDDEFLSVLNCSYTYTWQILAECMQVAFQHHGKNIASQVQIALSLTLEETNASTLITRAFRIFRNDDCEEDLRNAAKKALYHTSAFNYPYVEHLIESKIRVDYATASELDSEYDDLALIGYINLHHQRLNQILTTIATYCDENSSKYFKRSPQSMIVEYLRKAIWRWITNYPTEFSSLCNARRRLSGSVEKLFRYYSECATSVRRKIRLWPVMAMFLLMSPDVIHNLVYGQTQDRARSPLFDYHQNVEEFLSSVTKAMQSPKNQLCDTAVKIFVDIMLAATYVENAQPGQPTVAIHCLADLHWKDLGQKIMHNQLKVAVEGDIKLKTSFLTARFGRDPEGTIDEYFTFCLNNKSSPLYPMVMLRAMRNICKEDKMNNTNKSNVFLKRMPNSLRGLFETHLANIFKKDRHHEPSSLSRVVKRSVQKTGHAQYDHQIILCLLNIFNYNPSISIATNEGSRASAETSALLLGLCRCLTINISDIATEASNVLLKLFSLDYMELWDPNNMMPAFWEISSHVLVQMSTLLDNTKPPETSIDTSQLLEWIGTMIVNKNEFLRSHIENVHDGANLNMHAQTTMSLEYALMMRLWHPNVEIVSLASTDLGLLCDQAEMIQYALSEKNDELKQEVEGERNGNNDFIANLQGYRTLSEFGVVTGRAIQQKRIRAMLRNLGRQTVGNQNAWEATYSLWLDLTNHIKLIGPVVEEQMYRRTLSVHQGGYHHIRSLTQPTNRTNTVSSKERLIKKVGQLPSIENCVSDAELTEIQNEWGNMTGYLCALGGVQLQHVSRSMQRRNSNLSPSKTEIILEASKKKVESFIEELLKLLECTNERVGPFIRAHVREMIGTEMSSSLYPIVFTQLHSRIKEIIQKCASHSNELEPSSASQSFIEHAITIVRHVLDRTQENAEQLASIDVESILLSFLSYINYCGRHELMTMQIKKRMSQLVEVVMKNREFITFKKEISFRHQVTEAIMEWVEKTTVDESLVRPEIQRDFDISCMGALRALLEGLPLETSKIAASKEQTFSHYFQTLDRVMKKNKDASDGSMYFNICIQAMSNLLNANIDSGLAQSLRFAYDGDIMTRTAFLQVLTNILKHGAEFETLAVTKQARLHQLADLVLAENMLLVQTLCGLIELPEADEAVTNIIAITQAKGQLMAFVRLNINDEVKQCKSVPTLFRRNCVAAKVMSQFCKMTASDYLDQTLKPLLDEMYANQKMSFEVDPTKLKPGEDIKQNTENLIRVATKFVERILDSEPPKLFRSMLHDLANVVAGYFPEARLTAVGSAVFLRFLNPAITSPHFYKLADDAPSLELRRGLLLVSKVLQNLANNLAFSKEEYMRPINDFVNQYKQRCFDFFDKISREGDTMGGVKPSSSIPEHALLGLHALVFDNLEKMSQQITSRARTKESGEELGNTQYKELFDRLTTLLAQLGPPEDFEVTSDVPTEEQYSAFMSRMENAHDSSILKKDLVSEEVSANSGDKQIPCLLISCRRLLFTNHLESETYMYFLLKALQPLVGKPYDVLLDLSYVKERNLPPFEWLAKLQSLIPESYAKNLENAYIYRCNSVAAMYLADEKLVKRFVSSSPMLKRISFVERKFMLKEKLSSSSASIAHQSVSQQAQASNFIICQRSDPPLLAGSCKIKITENLFMLESLRIVKYFGQSIKVFDIYPIEDVTCLVHSKTAFTIKIHNLKSSFMLTTESRSADYRTAERISEVIKLQRKKRATTRIRTRKIRPNDVPGTLLNMALFNLGGNSASLRQSAYNLLHALAVTFNFDIATSLLDSKGMCIPRYDTDFIVNISRQLSDKDPHLTIEFLIECFTGIQKSVPQNAGKQQFVSMQQHRRLCFSYLQPWLKNLLLFNMPGSDEEDQKEKPEKIITELINLTTRFADDPLIRVPIQTQVWQTIGYYDDLLDDVLDKLIKKTSLHVWTVKSEPFLHTILSMASVNPQAVAGKIIYIFLNTLETSQPLNGSLEGSSKWTKIVCLLRILLFLSFHDRINICQHLPELLFIISMVVGIGNAFVRCTVLGLTVNLVQALKGSILLPIEYVQKLSDIESQLQQPKTHLLYGITGAAAGSVDFAFKYYTQEPQSSNDQPSLPTLENVVKLLLSIMDAALAGDIVSFPWYYRWLSLASRQACQWNEALQPRAFITLGVIAINVSDDILGMMLNILRVSIQNIGPSSKELIKAILMSLTRIHPEIDPNSSLVQNMFWIAIALVQIGDCDLLANALLLLDVNIKTLESWGCFKQMSLDAVMMKNREHIKEICDSIDTRTGFSFSSNFSFAIACNVLSGYLQPVPSTKLLAVRVLQRIYNMESGISNTENSGTEGLVSLSESSAGYIAALLPVSLDLKQRLAVSFAAEMSNRVSVIAPDYRQGGVVKWMSRLDDQKKLLAMSVLCLCLTSDLTDPERKNLWFVLNEASKLKPEFLYFYRTLVEKHLKETFKSRNDDIVNYATEVCLLLSSYENSVEPEVIVERHAQYVKELQSCGFWFLEKPAQARTVLAEKQPKNGVLSHECVQCAFLASTLLTQVLHHSDIPLCSFKDD